MLNILQDIEQQSQWPLLTAEQDTSLCDVVHTWLFQSAVHNMCFMDFVLYSATVLWKDNRNGLSKSNAQLPQPSALRCVLISNI